MPASDAMRIATLLGQSPLFRELPQPDLGRLAAGCRLHTWSKRSFLFHQGEAGNAAFLLIRGRVGLSRQTEAGREIVIKTVKPAEFFAEVILFQSDRYPVSAEALTEVRCVVLPREALRRLLDDSAFRDRFIGMLMERQRYLTGRVQYLTSYDLEERFFRFLSEQFGNGSHIETDLSRKDLASAVGATPESLSRLIRRLTDEGRLQWKGRIIRLIRSPDQGASD